MKKRIFSRKKAKKTAQNSPRRLNPNGARNALPRSAPCSNAYTQVRKTEGKKLHQTKKSVKHKMVI